MLKELSDLGKRNRKQEANKGKRIHNALKEELISIDLVIDRSGNFIKFDLIEKISRPAEALTAKKGKARLLLDKAEEILCYMPNEPSEKIIASVKFKHDLFLEKLSDYKDLIALQPVNKFYYENKDQGLEVAKASFEEQIPEKQRSGNIAFRVEGLSKRIHEEDEVYDAIIDNFEKNQKASLKDTTHICSVCGKNEYPIADEPHGMIKRVPDGNPMGCALVSYNEPAFLSYGLKGNLNSSVCSNCAKTYVEGINWLLANGQIQKNDKGKEYLKYSNRKNFGKDTAMVYWLREGNNFPDLDLLEEPNIGEIDELINSVTSGKYHGIGVETNHFYSFILSGAAARIFIRDWMEQSLIELKKSIALWFTKIVIMQFDYNQQKLLPHYARLYDLAKAAQNSKETNDVTLSRVAVYLWKSAISREKLPLWVLSAALKRLRFEEKGFTPTRLALIRLVLNQHIKEGGLEMKESLDNSNSSTAYISGRIFCTLESIQRAALGDNINAGIRERFFSSASMTPAAAFGRLMKMSQNHLSKLKGEKPGLAVTLDKELQSLVSKIDSFPILFTLEEQGKFAIGYYHQKQESYRKTAENKELKQALVE